MGARALSLSALLQELARAPVAGLGGGWEAALHPGAVIGRFELVREIGRGGFGFVWEARDRELGRAVAFKAVRLTSDATLREERLLREAELAARLAHPNIVTLHDLGRSVHGPYLVLELLHGRTLAARLEEGPLPLAEVIHIGVEIARGLAHAHEQGVVHRDLKPANVFLCPDGQVKILDFGLAHAFGARKLEGGTPAFMAPEQWRGAPEDERTDVFALGVILYRLLANDLPFRDGGASAVREPAAVPELEIADAPALSALVASMLESDPVKRPRDGEQVRSALAGIQRELERQPKVSEATPVRSRRPASPAPAVASGRRRWPSLVLVLPALGAALAVAALIGSSTAREAMASLFRPALPAQKILAVLPFRDTGGSRNDEAFSAGLCEMMTNKLHQWQGARSSVRVVSASEVHKEGIASPRAARDVFGATLGLEGAVHWGADRVTVTVNLVDTKTLLVLAARDVEAPRAEAATLLVPLLDRVAEMLRLEVAPEARRSLFEPERAAGAYEFYLQGRGYLRRHDRLENLDSALAVFDQALARDGGYALAHAGKAEAHLRRYELTRDPRFLAAARASAARAVELGEELAPVQLTMGLVQAATGEHAGAIRSFLRTLQLEPGSADAHRELARAYDAAGRETEAEATYRRAIQLRPDSWTAYKDLGAFYNRHGRLEEALPLFQRVVELTPDNYTGYANLGGIHFRLGHHDEAARALERSLALRPTDHAYSNLGTVYFYQKRYREAAELFRQAVELNDADARVWGNLGDAERWAGRAGEAIRAYRAAIAIAERQLHANPRDAELWARLAMHESALGERDKALRHIDEALRLAPADGLVLFRAALIQEEAGLRDRALASVRAALEAGFSTEEISGAPPLEALRRDPRYARFTAPRTTRGSNAK